MLTHDVDNTICVDPQTEHHIVQLICKRIEKILFTFTRYLVPCIQKYFVQTRSMPFLFTFIQLRTIKYLYSL